MKRSISILFFIVLTNLCFCAESPQLPERLWRTILNMEKYNPASKWQDSVSVKLFGHFSHRDSLQVAESVEVLDSLTETATLHMSSNERGNLEIFFLDNLNKNEFNHILALPEDEFIGWYYRSDKNGKTNVTRLFSLGVRMNLVPEGEHQDFLTNA